MPRLAASLVQLIQLVFSRLLRPGLFRPQSVSVRAIMSSPKTWQRTWPINTGNGWQLEKIVVNIHGGFVKEFWMETGSARSELATVETTPLPNVDVEARQVDETTKKTKKSKKKESKTWTVVDAAEEDDGGQDDEEHTSTASAQSS